MLYAKKLGYTPLGASGLGPNTVCLVLVVVLVFKPFHSTPPFLYFCYNYTTTALFLQVLARFFARFLAFLSLSP